MKNYYFLLAFACISYNGSAQDVSFTSQSFGSSSYNACTVDMNGDYLDDIVTVHPNMLTIYLQTETGLVATNYPVAGLGVGTVTPDWSIAAGDFDKNGFNDLVFGNGDRVSVVKANADGTGYTYVLYPQNIFSQRSNFVDIDNDGNLDLFVCHDVAQSHPYRNDGAGNLVFDYSLFPTSNEGGNYATVWIDYDNDGDIDMYEAKCRGGAAVNDPKRINLLYRNNGDGTYTDVAPAAGVDDHSQSWSDAWADYDNDGDFDFVLSNVFSDPNKFFRNNGDGTFTNIIADSGINAADNGSWEIQQADFNNDGFVDFIWENGLELYLNNGDMTFTGHSLPFGAGGIGDFNNDGFLDVQRGGTVYYNNGNPNKWLNVHLQGVQSNRNGIGARLELYGPWGKQIREIRSGEGFANMSSLNAHFGIGSATEIEKLVVKWPSGIVDVIMNPESNQSLFLLEGSSPELGLGENTASQLSLFPVPAKEFLNINAIDGIQMKSIQVFDLTGKAVITSELTEQRIPVSQLAIGTYIALLRDTEGKSYSQKFVKN